MKHPLFPSTIPIRSLAILAFAAVSPASVWAVSANATWVGAGTDTNWSTSANWSSGGVTPFALPSKLASGDATGGGFYSLFFYSSASKAINAAVDTLSPGWDYRALSFFSATGGNDITISGGVLYSEVNLGNINASDNSSTTVTTVHITSDILSANPLLTIQGTKYCPLDISGNITLTAASGTLALRNGTGGNTTTSKISGVIGGTSGGSVTVQTTTSSDWTLTNSNNRISNVVLGSGTLSAGANNAFGASPNLVIGVINTGSNTSANGYLNLRGYNQTISGVAYVTATAGGATNNGHVINSSATTSTFTYDNSTADQTYVGTIDQNINFVKAGNKNLTLTGSNTYTGSTTINGGTLTVNGSLAGSGVTVTAATLAGSGTSSSTVSGSDATINGNGLKLGAATLKGASTLSGYNKADSVTVANGTTSLTGTTKSTSALSVSQGATLNANGTIDGSAAISGLLKGSSTVTGNLAFTSGTLAPGTVHELTKVGGDFSMDASSKLVAEVSGAVAGTSYDQVQVGKNVSLAGTLDLTTLSGLTLGNKIILIDNTSSGTTTGYFATIITSDSTYTTASNSDYTFTVAGTEYLLSYTSSAENDGFNNDVTLTVVPEPGTWAMLMGGMGMLAFGQRLRSRRS